MQQKLVIFISLLLDLIAFTLILPLFPKIFDFYDSNEKDNTYHHLQTVLNSAREYIPIQGNGRQNVNSVMLGGFLGSLFSFLQFISSTIVGAASDKFGRKKVLIVCLFGTLASYMIWSASSMFILFLTSRIIGGISKANVSLSIAVMTDLSDRSTRSSAMALVGIAFAIGFVVGPIIGAVISAKLATGTMSTAIYRYPAYIACALTALNICFISIFYKESLPAEKRSKSLKANFEQAMQFINPISLFNFTPIKSVSQADLPLLKSVGVANFFYLFLYSGLEFTLTFLVHQRFNYDSMQQGKMFLFIGIFMILINGGYVRRIKEGAHLRAAIKSIFVLIPSFVVIALAQSQLIFYLGLLMYTYSSAVTVQCFTTLVANYGDEDEKGAITGLMRSVSALARAFGPLISSCIYWSCGPECSYILGALALTVPLCILIRVERQRKLQLQHTASAAAKKIE